jgi:hypothetical protein
LYRAFWQENDKDLRLKTLYSCLVAVKTYFDTHFALGVRMPPSFPYFMWIQNGYALLLGAKLCFGKADGWDLEHVRTLLDYTSVVDRITEKLEAILRLRSPHGKYEIFTRYIKHIRCNQMRKAMPTKTFVEEHRAASTPPVSSEEQMPDGDPLANPFLPNSGAEHQEQMFMDDHFWQGLLDVDNDWMMFGQ